MEKVAFISGANRGIGFETSKKLAEQGIKVILGSRDMDKGKKALEELLNPTEEEIISVRLGEKMHEALLNPDEMKYTWEIGDKFVVFNGRRDEEKIKKDYPGIKKININDAVSSDLAEKMSVDEIKDKIIESGILDHYKK